MPNPAAKSSPRPDVGDIVGGTVEVDGRTYLVPAAKVSGVCGDEMVGLSSEDIPGCPKGFVVWAIWSDGNLEVLIDGMTPSEIARAFLPKLRTSSAMRTHILYGVGGADGRTLNALIRHGLVIEAPEKPGYWKLSPHGEQVRALLEDEEPRR